METLKENLETKFENASFRIDDVDKNAHKLLPTGYSSENSDYGIITVIDRHTGEPKNIIDESLILKGVIKPIYIFRIYVSASIDTVNNIRDYMKKQHS